MASFQYHPAIVAQFPNLVSGIILGTGAANTPTSEPLAQLYMAEQQAVAARIGSTPLSELPALAAWRQAFRKFGTDPTKYRSAPEALLRRLTKKESVPTINQLVDIGNLVSIRYALPIAVFDRATIQGDVTVHFADGTERYTELGQSEAIHPDPGEVVFTDDTHTVIARRWCWRQSATSAAALTTTETLITIEAQHPNGRQDVEKAVTDFLELLGKYAGGRYNYAILDKNQPGV